MIVSWNWLKDYVTLDCDHITAAEKLMMSGLNLEEIEPQGDDFAIDLEVTSNRPDCLGHIGVARELTVLFDKTLQIPAAEISTSSEKTSDVTSVENQSPEHCTQYQARIIRGVKVGPSPEWLRKRLETLGLRSVNNVVDVTNYVLLECGQPLHAFDLNRLDGKKIVVRQAKKGEKIQAIDGKAYELDEQMCVIADASNPVAIAGVMGGKETEVDESTTDLLIETANFAPLSVRRTARKLSLFSDSSFRFERGVDVRQIDWASRRCCELIVQVAGGEILEDSIRIGNFEPALPEGITLRFAQVPRILGINVPVETCREILKKLGLTEEEFQGESAIYSAPSWRADLTREADLIEEIARIYGYDQIPENDPPLVCATAKSDQDRTTDIVHHVFNAAGFYEAITMSFVSAELSAAFNPRGLETQLQVEHSSRKKDNQLRSSLIPSLLVSRRANERTGTSNAQLYEISRVFTGWTKEGAIQPLSVGCVTSQSFFELKGLLETLIKTLNPQIRLEATACEATGYASGRVARLTLNGNDWGWLGEMDRKVLDQAGLRDAFTAAEFELQPLIEILEQAPQAQAIPQFPAVERDFNFLINDEITWQKLSGTITKSGGPLFTGVEFVSEYRGKPIESGKKTYLARAAFRSSERTLTGEEVDAAHAQIVAMCEQELAAVLR